MHHAAATLATVSRPFSAASTVVPFFAFLQPILARGAIPTDGELLVTNAPTVPPKSSLPIAADHPDAAPHPGDNALRLTAHIVVLLAMLALLVYCVIWAPRRQSRSVTPSAALDHPTFPLIEFHEAA